MDEFIFNQFRQVGRDAEVVHLWREERPGADRTNIERLWKRSSLQESIRFDDIFNVISWKNESEKSPELIYSAVSDTRVKTFLDWETYLGVRLTEIKHVYDDRAQFTFYQLMKGIEHLLKYPKAYEVLARACRNYYTTFLTTPERLVIPILGMAFANLTPPRALVEREYRASYASCGSYHLWELAWGHVSAQLIRARVNLPPNTGIRAVSFTPGTLLRVTTESKDALKLFVLADNLCMSPYKNEHLIALMVVDFPGQIHSDEMAHHPILRIIACAEVRLTALTPCPAEFQAGILASAGRTGEFAQLLTEARKAWCKKSVDMAVV